MFGAGFSRPWILAGPKTHYCYVCFTPARGVGGVCHGARARAPTRACVRACVRHGARVCVTPRLVFSTLAQGSARGRSRKWAIDGQLTSSPRATTRQALATRTNTRDALAPWRLGPQCRLTRLSLSARASKIATSMGLKVENGPAL